jgi:predicted outer membrane repeat protein
VYITLFLNYKCIKSPILSKFTVGFSGTETRLAERDHRHHPTVISGDIDRDDVVDALGITRSPEDIRGTNARMLFWFPDAAPSDTVLDGFVVTGGDGGGIGVGNDRTPILRNLHVIGNRSYTEGGGIFCGGGPTLENVTVENNVAANAGPFPSNGGGMVITAGTGVRIVNCQFRNNSASGKGGAIYVRQGYGFVAAPLIDRPTIIGNRAHEGAGLYVEETSGLMVVNSIFFANTAQTRGGAIGCAPSRGYPWTVANTAIVGNEAGEMGGGSYGGRLPRFCNSIFWQNRAPSAPQVKRVYDPSDDVLSGVYDCIVDGAVPTEEVICQDPAFLRSPEPGADGIWGTSDDIFDLRLLPSSPGLDAGDGDVLLSSEWEDELRVADLPHDLKGGPRILGSNVDIGPYEASWNQDLDGDGQNGILEAILGTSETAKDDSWVVTENFRTGAGPVTYSFIRLADLPPGLTGTVRWSSELDPLSWTEVMPSQMTTTPVPGRPDLLEVVVELPFATRPSRFFTILEVGFGDSGSKP